MVAAVPVMRCGTGPVIMSVIVNTHSHRDVDYHCHAVIAHNVACTNGVWLHVSRAHESSCENDGNSSNTATTVVAMVLTALQAIARRMWGSYLAALGACHHATATHVVKVTGAAPNATALAVGIR